MTKQSDALQELKQEGWFKKALTTEVKYIIGIIIFVAGVVAPYYTIKQDVALIKENHYTHIEVMTKQIEANSDELKDLKEKEQELMKIIIANQTKLDILMGK